MTRDDIIRMAREAKLLGEVNGWDVWYPDELERFAQLVAKKKGSEIAMQIISAAIVAEREACAKVCETLWNTPNNGMATEEECYGDQCAKAIRARGQQ